MISAVLYTLSLIMNSCLLVAFMQVSNNGLILFGESFTRKRLNALPDFDVPVIAPLWADFDFRDSGNVYHRASQDQTLLDAVASRIHETNPSYSDFRPTLCIVVTWFRARLFSGGFSSHEVSATIIILLYRSSRMLPVAYVETPELNCVLKKKKFPHYHT